MSEDMTPQGGPGGGGVPAGRRGMPAWLAVLLGLLVGAGLTVGGYALYQSGRGSGLLDSDASVAGTSTQQAEDVATGETDGGGAVVVIDGDGGEHPPDDVEPPPDDVEPPPNTNDPDTTGGSELANLSLQGSVQQSQQSAATWVTVATAKGTTQHIESREVNLTAGVYRVLVSVTDGRLNHLNVLALRQRPEPEHWLMWSSDRAVNGTYKGEEQSLHAGAYTVKGYQQDPPDAGTRWSIQLQKHR